MLLESLVSKALYGISRQPTDMKALGFQEYTPTIHSGLESTNAMVFRTLAEIRSASGNCAWDCLQRA